MIVSFVMFLTLTVQDSVPRRVQSVPAVDLRRYAGLWHEITRLPNRFQARCRGETTATHESRPNGELRVVNSCRDAGHWPIRVEGRAILTDARYSAEDLHGALHVRPNLPCRAASGF